MKKLLVSAIAAVAMSGVTSPTCVQAQATTMQEHQTGDMKMMPLSNEHQMSYDNVPQKVKDAARKHVGLARIESVNMGTLNGKTVYELNYRKSKHPDRTYELRVSEDGKIISEHLLKSSKTPS